MSISDEEKSLQTRPPAANFAKLFKLLLTNFPHKPEGLALGRPFQPNLMFARGPGHEEKGFIKLALERP